MKNFLLIFCLLGGPFLFVSTVMAADIGLKIFSDDLTLAKELSFLTEEFQGTTRLQVADVIGNSDKEIIVSYGNRENPIIVVYDLSGKLLNSWQPYVPGFTGEVVLAVADLDKDGKAEIICSPGPGGGPQIRIFNGSGQTKFVPYFWAYDSSYRRGTEVATGDVDGDGFQDILVSVIKDNKALIKVYTRYGYQIGSTIEFDLDSSFEPVKLAALDLGSDGVEEIIVGFGSGNEPTVRILRRDGSVIKEFLAYGKSFSGGVNLSVVKTAQLKMIITGAGFSGGPHIRFFDSFGNLVKHPAFFAYGNDVRGGVNVDYADLDNDGSYELITLPQQVNTQNDQFIYKYIDIDISEQKLNYYQNGKIVDSFIVSSGLPSMPTPLGEYKIWQKNPRAYSNKYGLYMPWWMSFKPSYGLHELPEWPSGYKEGQNHLGQQVSHGCVRLGVGPAETLYNWTPIGTPVLIHE